MSPQVPVYASGDGGSGDLGGYEAGAASDEADAGLAMLQVRTRTGVD